MDETPPPNQPQGEPGQRLDLNSIASRFMRGLQQHFDVMAFSMASREAATEATYIERVARPGVMPLSQAHRNFEQTQAYTRDLFVRNVLNDCLNLTMACLSNCHLFLLLLRLQKEGQPSEERQREIQQAQDRFAQAPLDEKFNALEKEFGIMCELEDTVTSIGFALQCNVQRQNVVGDEDIDDSGELAFDLKMLGEQARAQREAGLMPEAVELDDHRLVFRKGDRLSFQDDELQALNITLAVFFDQLFRSIQAYGQSLENPDGPNA